MKTLYKLDFDCGRHGSLEGLFIADSDDMNKIVEEKTIIYFGEVLGKHSEIFGPIEEGDYEEITNDEKVIAVVEFYKLETGFNPFHYHTVDEEDLEDKE